MKAFIRFLLILLVTFSFSCSNSREYEEKAVGKQEIVKDTIEEKVELKLKNEPKLDLQEDTIVNVPKVINDTMPVVGLLLSVEESDFWGRVWLHTKIDGEYKNYAYWGEPNTEYIGSGSFEHVRKLVGKKIAL